MRQVLGADDVAVRRGLLQVIDARVKLVSMAVLLIAAALVHEPSVLLVMYVLAVGLAAVSAIPAWFFVKRVWLFIPVFTAIVVLPATLNVVTDGDIVVPLGTWFGHQVGITSQGLRGAVTLVMRVAVSISIVVLVTLTTSWTRVLTALRSLRVPRMFILVLGMAYRYLFHLLDTADEMYVARKARTVATKVDPHSARQIVSATAGALFGKSHALAEEVHQAMTARGWNGEARTLGSARVTSRDVVFGVACVAVGLALVFVDRGLRG